MDTPRGLWAGAGALAIFAVIAVLVRGIRWDEGYEHAQVLAGQVVYPPGHPLPYYLSRAYSLQTHGLAWLMMAGAGPVLLNGLRNVLFLLATLLPPYLFGAHLTGRIAWGFAAALIALQGAYLEFDGSYPLAVWPQLYSNGPIGGGFALFTLYLGLAGHGRAAALCFGLMPAIHLGQFPPLLALLPLGLWQYRRYTRKMAGTHPYDWLAIGLGLSALLWVYVRYALSAPVLTTIGTPEEIDAIWRVYTFRLDPHRQFPPNNGHILAVGTLVLGGILSLRRDTSRAQWFVNGLSLYAAVVAMTVWGTMSLHTWLGEELPRTFIAWMPYRLFNHLPVVSLVLCLYAISRLPRAHGSVVIGGALLFGVVQPWLAFVTPENFYLRYVSGGELTAFGIWGAAMATAILWHRNSVLGSVAATVVPALLLSPLHLFGSLCVLGGGSVALVLFREKIIPFRTASAMNLAVIVLLSLLTASLLAHQFRFRSSLPRSACEEFLAKQPEPGPERLPILAPPDTYGLQAHTGRPIIFDSATFSLISYVPEIGPEIVRMHHTLFGYDPLGVAGAAHGNWQAAWTARDVDHWNAVAERHGFGTVMAYPGHPLNMPQSETCGDAILYYP